MHRNLTNWLSSYLKCPSRHLIGMATTVWIAIALTPSSSSAVPTVVSAPVVEEQVIDMVIASVNGKPITLQDVASRLSSPRSLSFEQAAKDPEVRATLDALVLEKLVREEAEARKIGVSNDEIDRYIDEVAKRNNLSREGFEKALVEMGSSVERYRGQVETEILRGRLTNAYIKGGVTVTDEEITQYLEEHEAHRKSGARIGMSIITLRRANHSQKEFESRRAALERELQEGVAFEELARRYSDGPNAAEGGAMGLVAESDLSGEIFEAVFPLKPGEVSRIIDDGEMVQVFKVSERLGAEGSEARAREEAKEILMRQKTEAGIQGFFQGELYKRYAVDKKI